MFQYFKDIPGYEFLSGHVIETPFEVYEDNAGALFLCVMGEDSQCLRIFVGFQNHMSSLQEAIMQLMEDPKAYGLWDGDLSDETGADADWLYHNCTGKLIADNDGIYMHNLGIAGRLALLGEDETEIPLF